MTGLTKFYELSTSVPLCTLEDMLMTWLMTNEKSFALCKVTSEPYKALIQLIKIQAEKAMLRNCYAAARVELTKEAEQWLYHYDTLTNMCYLGDWCPYWNKWKTEIKFDTEKGWETPANSLEQLVASIYGKSCQNCMYSCFEPNNAYCLCGVRSGLYDKQQYEQRACSHFVEDPKSTTDYAADIGITEKELDETENACSKAFSEQNKAHAKYYEQQGCPRFEPEEAHLYTKQEYKQMINESKEKNK